MRLLLLAALALPARARAAEPMTPNASPVSAPGPGRSASEFKAVLVVIDGVRDLELRGEAKDDEGRPVPAGSLWPNLMRLKETGLFLPEMRIDNPTGISLPAYADIFSGRRQEKILSNEPKDVDLHSHYPTLFEAVKRKHLQDPNSVAILASWQPLCRMSVSGFGPESDFFRSCGWAKGKYFKPEVYEGSRTDEDTVVELLQEVPKRHPRLVFVHLGNADEEAHLQDDVRRKAKVSYGIFHYHQALRASDYYVGRIWKALQDDPFYKGSTYLIVATDHGRDDVPDPAQWWDHGECVKIGDKKLCSGCQHVFGLIVGPGVKPAVSRRLYHHSDLAPTIARLLGVSLPEATGKPIAELAYP